MSETTGTSAKNPASAVRRFMQTWRRLRGEHLRRRRLRELLELVRPYRSRVIVMFIALAFATAASQMPPLLAKYAIDDGIAKKDTGVLALVVAIYLASAIVYWAGTYLQTYLVGWVGQRSLQDLRIKLFAHMQRLSIGFYSRNKTGVLTSRLTNDVQALDQLVTDGVVTLFSSTITLVFTVVVLFYYDATLALATFLVFPLVALGSFVFRIVSTDVYRLTRERIAAVTSYLQETISGVQVVRSYGQEHRHIDEFVELSEANRDTHMKTVYLNASYFPVIELLSAISTAVVIVFGGYRAINGDITIGTLVLFIGYLQNFFDPIQSLSQLYTTFQAGMAALDKIFDLLLRKPDVVDKPDAEELPRMRGEIDFDSVSFSYSEPDADEQVWALNDIDIHVTPGETLALVGATGAGKSTFAKLVARFYDPQRGSVKIDGHDLRDLSSASLRSQLGYVPQEGYLFSGTIADNIALGKPDATRDEVVAAARAVGADDVIAALPEGFDTPVGERGSMLSAGQRQLVAFARALIADPRLLILDEATASVDIGTELKIEQGLRRLLAGRTAIVIAHRLSTIQGATRIAVIEQGRIVELGSHDELLELRGHYASLYESWARNVA